MVRMTVAVWAWVLVATARVLGSQDGGERRRGAEPGDERDRGDVPGWVMITVMSAVLVVAILTVFEPQIKDALTDILKKVSDKK